MSSAKEVTKFYLLVTILLIVGWSWCIYNVNVSALPDNSFSMCLFKSATGIPCPSCGTTHAISHILHGNYSAAIDNNILGFFALLFMIIFPVWIVVDLLLKRITLYNTFKKVKSKPLILYLFLTLIAINWIWNLYKIN